MQLPTGPWLKVELALEIQDPAGLVQLDLAEEIIKVFSNRSDEQCDAMRQSLRRWAMQWPRESERKVLRKSLNLRVFRGDTTNQVDLHGNRANPNLWYYEPDDYTGGMIWSQGYPSRAEAYYAAGCHVDR